MDRLIRYFYPTMAGIIYPFRLLAKRLSLVLLIYMLLRFIFLMANTHYFPPAGLHDMVKITLAGLRFDISAIIYTNSLFILMGILPFSFYYTRAYQLILKVLFLFTNLFCVALMLIDTGYYRYTLKRSTPEIFKFSGEFLNVLPAVVRDYWWLLLLFAGITYFLIRFYPQCRKLIGPVRINRRTAGMLILLWSVTIFLGVTGARGGLQLKPITPITAASTVDPEWIPVVVNTPFQFIYTLDHRFIEPRQYFDSRDALLAEFDYCQDCDTFNGDGLPSLYRRADVNIMIIILESFSQQWIGAYGSLKGFTPFLDSLAADGLLFKNMYSNGKRSVDGLPAILSSIPYLMPEGFLQSPYQMNRIEGAGKLLKEKGYQTAFFHGGNNGTFHFDSYAKAAGFERYYGRKEFGDDRYYDGLWGIYDEPFFQFAAHQIKQLDKPFGVVLYSLSSHHPYKIPEIYADRLPEGPHPVCKSIAYTDFALSRFFKAIRQEPWFNQTLFIITADHTSDMPPGMEGGFLTRYAIPLIIYAPWRKTGVHIRYPVQQIDLLPTIADITGCDGQIGTFGMSVLKPGQRYVYFYRNGIYTIYDGRFLLHFDGDRPIEMCDLVSDPDCKANVSDRYIDERERLMRHLKAVIQTYEEAMVNNRLTCTD